MSKHDQLHRHNTASSPAYAYGIHATAGGAGAAPNAKLRSKVVPVPPHQTTKGEGYCAHAHGQPLRMTWARLLKHVFDIDVEKCACGGKLKLMAVIEELAVIGKILKHIGLDPQPPPIARAQRVVDFLECA